MLFLTRKRLNGFVASGRIFSKKQDVLNWHEKYHSKYYNIAINRNKYYFYFPEGDFTKVVPVPYISRKKRWDTKSGKWKTTIDLFIFKICIYELARPWPAKKYIVDKNYSIEF